MIRMSFTVSSMRQVKKAVEQLGKKYEKKLAKALYIAGLFIQAESQKIVPVDTGFLRASAFTRIKKDNFGYVCEVGYRAHYAIYVHENLNAKHASGSSAKFLEIPFNEKADKVIEIIVAVLTES